MNFEISNHIAIQVKDYDKAVEHYQSVMGMEVISKGKNYAEVKSGNTIQS